MLARLTAFVVWALVAATVVFWGLRLLVRPQPAPSYAVAVGDAGALRGDLTRLLGATPAAPGAGPAAAPELASRFKLLGVMASFLEKLPPRPDDADTPLRLVFMVPLAGDIAAFASRCAAGDRASSCPTPGSG